VDFGVDNTMAVVSDTGKSILFKGRFIKSVNQYFMKKKAERISLMSKGKETTERVWSKYLDRLSAYRTSYIVVPMWYPCDVLFAYREGYYHRDFDSCGL
ncbi:hypothetical protein CGK76_11615, partial [Erysipelotrichaceae bacterium 7770_A6]|nr:hypothetical protein [Erysipelotrichaceae bacterium 7770_A6]